jgi:hypothetical protein
LKRRVAWAILNWAARILSGRITLAHDPHRDPESLMRSLVAVTQLRDPKWSMTGKPSHQGEVLIVGSSSFWRVVKLIRDMVKPACVMFRWLLFFLGNHEQEFDIPRAQLTLTAVPMPLRSPWMDSIAQTRPTSSKRANFSDQVGGVTILVLVVRKGLCFLLEELSCPRPRSSTAILASSASSYLFCRYN